MVRPFKDGMLEQACPMADILGEVASQLDELKVLRLQADFEMAPS
jgi:adenylate cyclase